MKIPIEKSLIEIWKSNLIPFGLFDEVYGQVIADKLREIAKKLGRNAFVTYNGSQGGWGMVNSSIEFREFWTYRLHPSFVCKHPEPTGALIETITGTPICTRTCSWCNKPMPFEPVNSCVGCKHNGPTFDVLPCSLCTRNNTRKINSDNPNISDKYKPKIELKSCGNCKFQIVKSNEFPCRICSNNRPIPGDCRFNWEPKEDIREHVNEEQLKRTSEEKKYVVYDIYNDAGVYRVKGILHNVDGMSIAIAVWNVGFAGIKYRAPKSSVETDFQMRMPHPSVENGPFVPIKIKFWKYRISFIPISS